MNDIDLSTAADIAGRPQREREAYAAWETTGNLSMVSRDLGIPYTTLISWQKKYQWKEEKQGWLRSFGELAVEVGRYEFSKTVEKAAVRLGRLLDDDEASHHDQRENIKLVMQFIGETLGQHNQPLVDARQVHIHEQPRADPFIKATSILEANVAQTNVDKRRGSRKTF
jgi:hypothetical protein